jgi:hypothetical protein
VDTSLALPLSQFSTANLLGFLLQIERVEFYGQAEVSLKKIVMSVRIMGSKTRKIVAIFKPKSIPSN